MRKLLFFTIAFLGLLQAEQTRAQNKAASAVPQTASQLQRSTPLLSARQTSAVISTTTSTCMSINLPTPAAWTLSNYGTGTPFAADGFVNGCNLYGDKEKAMYFDVSASANTMITQVYVGFNHAYTTTPSKTVAVRIYDGTSGTPGTALGSATISMSTIMSDVSANQYSLLIFSSPINLPASKKFFTSVDVTNLQWTSTIHDSLSIVSNTDPQTSPTPAWEKWSTNAWYNYANINSWGLNISLLIHPFLTQAPLVATFTPTVNTVCSGQSLNYNSAGSTTGGSFQWVLNGSSTPTALGATTPASYPTAGSYTTYLIVSDACGSLKLAQNTLTVITSPTVTAAPSSTTVCSGSNVTLSGGGASTYTWSGGISNAVPFSATASVNYTVTGTAANGCTNSAVSSVIANANPTVTANTTTNSVCSGNSVTLSGGGASTYTWSGGVSDGISFVPSTTNSYTVTATAANSCTGTAVVSVSVAPNPTVTATPSSTTVCNGASVAFSGAGASSYAWSGGISNGVSFPAAGTATYMVTGTAANGCTATAVTSLSVNPNPTVTANSTATMVCTGQSITLTGGGATTYTWTGGVTNAVAFIPSSSNTYTVTGTDANGCPGTATVGIVVSACTGVTALTQTSVQFEVYPNPSSGEFTVSTPLASPSLFVEVYDNIGKLVLSENLNAGKQLVKANFPAGIYTVKLTDNGNTLSVRKLICN